MPPYYAFAGALGKRGIVRVKGLCHIAEGMA